MVSIKSTIRARVSGPTLGPLLTTLDTVATDTLAALAISLMVALDNETSETYKSLAKLLLRALVFNGLMEFLKFLKSYCH